MIRGIDHIGVAVSNLDDAIALYRDILGFRLEGISIVEEQKVRVALFSTDGEVKIELLAPTENTSPVARFMERRGEGIHHISLKVENVEAALEELRRNRLELVDEKPRIGAEGVKVAFIHPKSTRRVLFELCEKP